MNIQNQQAKANPLKKIEPVLVAIALVSALLLLLSMTTVAQIVGADPRELIRGTRQNMARNPETVQFISKRSPFFISLLVKPERLQTFSQLATNPSDRGKLRHQLDFFKQQLRQNWLLDYEKDIQPTYYSGGVLCGPSITASANYPKGVCSRSGVHYPKGPCDSTAKEIAKPRKDAFFAATQSLGAS